MLASIVGQSLRFSAIQAIRETETLLSGTADIGQPEKYKRLAFKVTESENPSDIDDKRIISSLFSKYALHTPQDEIILLYSENNTPSVALELDTANRGHEHGTPVPRSPFGSLQTINYLFNRILPVIPKAEDQKAVFWSIIAGLIRKPNMSYSVFGDPEETIISQQPDNSIPQLLSQLKQISA